MRRALLVALSVALVSEAGAKGVERAPLRGSAVVAAPSYPVDFAPPMHPEPVPVAVAPPVHWVPPVTDPAVLPFRLEVGGRYWFKLRQAGEVPVRPSELQRHDRVAPDL
jgi:hypothetical protein